MKIKTVVQRALTTAIADQPRFFRTRDASEHFAMTSAHPSSEKAYHAVIGRTLARRPDVRLVARGPWGARRSLGTHLNASDIR